MQEIQQQFGSVQKAATVLVCCMTYLVHAPFAGISQGQEMPPRPANSTPTQPETSQDWDKANGVHESLSDITPDGSRSNSYANERSDNLRIVEASQYLVKNPRFADPGKYLAKPHESFVATRQLSGNTRINQYLPVRQEGADDLFSESGVDQAIPANPFHGIQQNDGSGLLANRPLSVKQPIILDDFRLISYSEFTQTPFESHYAYWVAGRFCHRPLYFEEPCLERNGNAVFLQPVVSFAHFAGNVLVSPYKIGSRPPKCCISTFGHRSPCQFTPCKEPVLPISVRGTVLQTLIVAALIL